MPRMFRLFVVALVALGGISAAQTAARAQTKPIVTTLGPDFPKTEIFIGNSFFYYNNSMHSHVLAMQRVADPANKGAYRATSVTIGGSGLDWHDVESYFRPKAIGSYSFDDQNNVMFNKLDKLFDVAIMMDCSQCPIHPTLKTGIHRIRQKGQRHRARQGRQAGVLHVLGLCRQAGNDGATGRGLYGCRQ